MELSSRNKLALYQTAADDESASLEQRMRFARRANSLRIIARLRSGDDNLSGPQVEGVGRSLDEGDAESRLFSPVRLAGNVKESADEACKKLLNQHQPSEALAHKLIRLLESIG